MQQNLINFVKGDVIGAEFEMSKSPSYNKKEIINPIWTDDTSQMLCVIEALIKSENATDKLHTFKECFKENLLKWYYEGYLTPNKKAIGTGRTTREAMNALRNNVPVINDKLSSGALMRCAPFLFTKDIDLLYTAVCLTHKNELHYKYCKAYLSLYRKDVKTKLVIPDEEVPWIKNDASDIMKFIFRNRHLIDSEVVLKSRIQPNTDLILEKILKTGGDTDTTLALIGALNDGEFLPSIKFQCPDFMLYIFENFEKMIKRNEY